MMAIFIDFALEEAIFYPDLAYLLDRRRQTGSIGGSAFPRRVMTKIGSDDRANADQRRSALMLAAQAGDGAAYRMLLRECIPIIKAIARRRGLLADRIDDVVQDVLLTIHRVRQTYDPKRSFTAWLAVIAERRAIDLIRRTRRQAQREVYAPLAFESHADVVEDPSRNIAFADASGRVAHAVETLPARQREAVQYLVVEERSLADTAAMTRRSKGSLKVNLHRALRALRGRIESGGKTMETLSNNDSPHERLIQHLATDLAPVHRLYSPSVRALGWLVVVATTAIVLATYADLPAIGRRLAAAPDMWLAVVGSVATAVLAAFAAFRLCLPDTRARLGSSSAACGTFVGRSQWVRLSADVVCTRNPRSRSERGPRLPSFYRRTSQCPCRPCSL